MMLSLWRKRSFSHQTATLVVVICMLALMLFSVAFLSLQYSLLKQQSRYALNTLPRVWPITVSRHSPSATAIRQA